ncbi:MAG: MAPEG family protein [Rhodobacteraceae bacterium]|nr:MAPEG family protein [Paracoccaceae bacterium]
MTFITALTLYGLLSLILIGNEIFYTYGTQGFGFGFSANRKTVEKSPLGLRIQRTYQNHVEAASYGVPVLAAAALTGLQGQGPELAALLFILGRTAFALLYYTGIPFIRVPAFLLSTLSTLYIAYSVLMATMA